MKKRSGLLMTVLVFALLSVLVVPAYAGPPDDNVGGLWKYKPTIVGTRLAGGNTFLTTQEEAVWSGTFDGTSTEDGKVVVHSSGAWSFKGIVTFEGVVNDNDNEGTMKMRVVGSRPDVFTEWTGKWVIISGTGGLAGLRAVLL